MSDDKLAGGSATTAGVNNTRRPALPALLALHYGTMVFGAAVIVQFYLAGTGIFAAKGPLDHAASLDPHRQLGLVLAGLALLILIAGILARPGRRILSATIALFVLTGIEGTLASAGTSAPYVGALHPVVAAAILGAAVWIVLMTRRATSTS